VREGDQVKVTLNAPAPLDYLEFYLLDPVGLEYKVATQSLGETSSDVVFYADDYYFPQSGEYQLKLVDYTNPNQEHVDIERLEYRGRKVVSVPKADPTPPIQSPEIECGTAMVGGTCLPPVPVMPGSGYGVPSSYISPVTVPYEVVPYGPSAGSSPIYPSAQPQITAQGYTIQVGAFTSSSSARALQERLQRNGFDAYIAESSKTGKALFRVRVGRFLDKSSASQEVQRLRRNGFTDTWITDLT
jgi:hypothetical protein